MHDDLPAYPPSHEPTQLAGNPYEGLYSGLPSFAPPPPLQTRRRWGLVILWSVSLCIAFCLGYLLGGISAHPASSQQMLHRAASTISPSLPASPTPTVDLTYTAVDLWNDLNAAGIHPQYVSWDQTIWSWSEDSYYVSVHATSSVQFADDSTCSGPCDSTPVGIWVYASKPEATQAYIDVATAVQQGSGRSTQYSYVPTDGYAHGRCLLIGGTQQSLYEQVVTRNCL